MKKSIKPYGACTGYKYRHRRKYYRKLIKPISFFTRTQICNSILGSEVKVRFVKQILRWFKKRPKNYNISINLEAKKNLKNLDVWNLGNSNLKKNRYLINDGDVLNMSTWMYKAAWKKLLSKLKLNLLEYKILKRHKYNIFFNFFVKDIEVPEIKVVGKYTPAKFKVAKKNMMKQSENKITLDIVCKNTKSIQIYITLGYGFMRDLNRIITMYYSKSFGREAKIKEETIMSYYLGRYVEKKFFWERQEGESILARDLRIKLYQEERAKKIMWWQRK